MYPKHYHFKLIFEKKMRFFYFFSSYRVFAPWCVFYILNGTSQFGHSIFMRKIGSAFRFPCVHSRKGRFIYPECFNNRAEYQFWSSNVNDNEGKLAIQFLGCLGHGSRVRRSTCVTATAGCGHQVSQLRSEEEPQSYRGQLGPGPVTTGLEAGKGVS